MHLYYGWFGYSIGEGRFGYWASNVLQRPWYPSHARRVI
jgi:hypothetical protein